MSVDDRKGKCGMYGMSGAVGYGLYARDILWKAEICNNLDLDILSRITVGTVFDIVCLEDNDYLMYIPAKMNWEYKKDECFTNSAECKEYFWKKLSHYVDMEKDDFMEELNYVDIVYEG
jgi:hypothetical protein